MIYLDEAASAPPQRSVLEAMWPYLGAHFANPASRHEHGLAAESALQDARRRVADQLGARPAEIIFTSGGTESNNAAVKGIAFAAPRGRHILVSAIEHPAVLESAAWLERFGFTVEHLPVDRDGLVSAEALKQMIRPDTTLVSVQTASSDVGTVQEIPALSAAAAEHKVPFHTDAVQAAGAMDLKVDDLGVQALSLAGHKLGTPKGIGVLYLRRRTAFEPLIHGGGQQRDRRSGTENVAGAVGMAAALELAAQADVHALQHRRDLFIHAVESRVQSAQLTGHRTQRLPGHASFSIGARSGESVLLDLERAGISCSSGSACAAESSDPNPALIAMGYSPEQAQSALRFSFGAQTSEEDLNRAAQALVRAAASDSHQPLVRSQKAPTTGAVTP